MHVAVSQALQTITNPIPAHSHLSTVELDPAHRPRARQTTNGAQPRQAEVPDTDLALRGTCSSAIGLKASSQFLQPEGFAARDGDANS
jgi:hypothetical protein